MCIPSHCGIHIRKSQPPEPPGRSDWKKSVRPSVEMLGQSSSCEVLIASKEMGGPKGSETLARFAIDRSQLFVCRPEVKKSTRPSAEMYAEQPQPGLLTVGPRFTAVPQLSCTVARVVTQRSSAPYPPGRSEWKNGSSPSAEMLGLWSPDRLLTVGPRFMRCRR